MSNSNHHFIESLQQIKAVCSPIRQEIMDTVIVKGKCSITEIADDLGRPADGLYYHMKALIKEQLLIAVGENKNNPRQETLYSLTKEGSLIEVKYNQTDAQKVQAINKMVKSMLKISMKDFENGLTHTGAVFEGESRNLWAARIKSRLNQKQIKKANYHLQELLSIFKGTKNSKDKNDYSSKNLYALQWVLAPVKAQPKRRK